MFLTLDRVVTDGLWRHMWSLCIFFKGQSWDNIKNGPISGWYDFSVREMPQ